jgi:hypothetical protein
MQRAGILRDGRATAYALGLEITREHGADVVSHGGSTAGYRAYLGRVPATGVSVALLCNNGSIRSDLLGPELLAIADGDTTTASELEPPALGPAATDGGRAKLTGQFRNMRTGQTVQLRPFRDGVTLNTWVGFTERARTICTYEGIRRTLIAELDASGSARRFRIAYATGDAVAYERADAWKPDSIALRDFAGRYDSRDADAEWTIQRDGDTLRVLRRTGQADAMVPSYRDAFRVPSVGWLVTFQRDARDRVRGFEVRTTRMRALPFVRIGSTSRR